MIPFPGEFCKNKLSQDFEYDPDDWVKSLKYWNECWQKWMESEIYQSFLWYMKKGLFWNKPCDQEWINDGT